MSDVNTAKPASTNSSRNKALLVLTLIFITVGGGFFLYEYLWAQFREHTEDAYVGGNLLYINSQINGTVVAVPVEDNQSVTAGTTLVQFDDSDAQVTLSDAEAKLGESVRQVQQQFAAVDTAAATLAQKQTELNRANEDYSRRAALKNMISAEEVTHAQANLNTAKASLTVAQKQLISAQSTIKGTTIRQHPSVLRARASYIQAFLNLQRTRIIAPISGTIAKRSVQVGQRISPEASLLTLVPLDALWVDANFKEAQLRHIRIGQDALLIADIYGKEVEYHGKVIGISAGTGAAFSLLPPQNASGNWVKVVQRVPVRVALNPQDLIKHPLRIGLSMSVTIDTHHREGSVLNAQPSSMTPSSTTIYSNELAKAEKQADHIISKAIGL